MHCTVVMACAHGPVEQLLHIFYPNTILCEHFLFLNHSNPYRLVSDDIWWRAQIMKLLIKKKDFLNTQSSR